MKKKIFLIILCMITINVLAQSSEKRYLLIYSEIKQKTKIDNSKSSLKAIEVDSYNKFKDDFKILSVYFRDFSDDHFKSCQKGDSIYITFNYNNDTFDIDNRNGEINTTKLGKILKNKKKIFSIKIDSKKIVSSKIEYYYVLIKCSACSGIVDAMSSVKINSNNVLLINSNIEEISNFELDNISAYRIYTNLIRQ